MIVAAKATNPASDTMRIWDAVAKTDPAHTKKVNQRGGFTAISAHYQIMSATKQFGPIGEGWGYINGDLIFQDGLVIVPVTIWHGSRDNTFGPLFGAADLHAFNKLDSDAPKKASTDGLTKGLSQLGFNADVFLGRFDDNKYVEAVAREFRDAEKAGQGQSQDGTVSLDPANSIPARTKLEGPYTSKSALWKAVKEFDREVRSCGDIDSLEAFMAEKDTHALFEQLERDAPQLLHGGDGLPGEFEPLLALVSKLRTDLNAPTYINAG